MERDTGKPFVSKVVRYLDQLTIRPDRYENDMPRPPALSAVVWINPVPQNEAERCSMEQNESANCVVSGTTNESDTETTYYIPKKVVSRLLIHSVGPFIG